VKARDRAPVVQRRADSYCQDGRVTTTGQAIRARGWRRMFHLHADRLGQKIPPLDALEDEMGKRIASGESEEDVTLAVIEDFEKSASTVNARTTPLVPASGIVLTGAGILANASGQGEAAKIITLFAMAFALGVLGFLATALFTHAVARASASHRRERISPSSTIGS
jgi:hypothetical protein